MEEILIDISPGGNVKIEAKGFSGCGCARATEEIELVLGGGAKRKEKPEFYSPPTSMGTHTKQTF